jgi:hypothetical protein
MPFRSLSTLESWIDEFRRMHPSHVGRVRIIPQDGAERADTGLVVFELPNAPTVTYLQPDSADDARWVVTLESREDVVTLGAAQVATLAAALQLVSDLCAFLEAKSA